MSSRKPKLGQNFLIDEAACRRIAESLGDTSDRTVVEIGPGHGAITALLAARCRRLHCIEFDPALARELAFRFRNDPHVTIHTADILSTDLASLEAGSPQPEAENPKLDAKTPTTTLDIVGNLPYYITSDILLHLYTAARQGILHRAVVMMQREVADRIAAAPGSSDYGALSAFTQMHAHAEPLFTLPPSSFSPPPDVFSTVLRLDFAPRFAELRVDPEGFNKFLRGTFAQKRKTLSNNLRAAGYDATRLAAAWPASIPAQARAEAVSLESMAELYRTLRILP
jgi:16S rRNA (adenine1518-N6/adenine1519-N6)-dimethyltransferase